MALFNHRAKNKERQYNKRKGLELVRRKPGYSCLLLLVGANCLVRCRGLNLKLYSRKLLTKQHEIT